MIYKMYSLARIGLAMVLLFTLSRKAHSQEWNPDSLEVYLHTVEVGDLVFNNFGHTALRFYDPETGRDFMYNWGIFNFSDPLTFSFNFYKGILRYQLGIYKTSYAKSRYAKEGRTVWQDKLRLTTREKEVLLKRIYWNMMPENRTYNYDYFFDNCATRIRDYLDEALFGYLKLSTEDKLSGSNYRDMVRSHYLSVPGIEVGLEIIMNGRLEREMSLWNIMFLPKSLRDVLIELKRPDGQPIMEPDRELFHFPVPKPYPVSGQVLWSLPVFVIIILGLISTVFFNKINMLFLKLMAVVGMLFFSFSGLVGIILPLNWLFSEHLDLQRNWNILIFWPVHFYLCLIFWQFLVKNRDLLKARRRLKLYFSLYLSAFVIGLLGWFWGIIEQDISRILCSFGLVSLGLMLLAIQAMGILIEEQKCE